MKKVLLLTTLIVLALVQSHSMSMAQSNVENEAKSPEPIVVVDTSQEAKVGITQSEKPAEDAVLSARPIDIMLVLDNSGSMKTNDPHFLTREVVTSFVQDLAPGWRLGMIVFDKGAEIVEPLSELSTDVDRNRFLQNLSRLNYKGQLTNSPAAIEKANYELRTKGRDKARKVIIFLTDGIVDLGNKKQDADKSAWLRESLTKESKQIGIGIHGIAFTDQADFSLIQTLANHTGGQYYRAFKAEEIADTFNQIKDFINKPEPEPQVAAAPSTATSPTLSPSPVPAQPSSAVVQLHHRRRLFPSRYSWQLSWL
jgi:Mg-chelatase subunit ChlD